MGTSQEKLYFAVATCIVHFSQVIDYRSLTQGYTCIQLVVTYVEAESKFISNNSHLFVHFLNSHVNFASKKHYHSSMKLQFVSFLYAYFIALYRLFSVLHKSISQHQNQCETATCTS